MTRSARTPRVAILGLGLIGGSLGLALRRKGMMVSGYDRRAETMRQARRRGAVSSASPTVGGAVAGADLVVLSVPVQAIPDTLAAAGRHLRTGTVVTDTASVKVAVLRWIAGRLPPGVPFVGGHPMAGSERSGIAAASPDLFHGRTVVLTPVPGTSRAALGRVARLWERCGARIVRMTPARHDAVVAAVSHVPHALAVTLAGGALKDAAARRLAAGGFLDATRIAAASPHLWEGIFRANAGPLLRALREQAARERALIRAVRQADPQSLRKLLRAAAVRRRALARARAR